MMIRLKDIWIMRSIWANEKYLLMFLLSNQIEDRRIFNKAFKVGFVFGVLLFIVANIINYYHAYLKYEEFLKKYKGIPCCHDSGFVWGFPFIWEGYDYGLIENGVDGLLLNFLVLCVFGFVSAIFLKIIAGKLSSKNPAR